MERAESSWSSTSDRAEHAAGAGRPLGCRRRSEQPPGEPGLMEQALPVLRAVARTLWRRWGGRHDLDELASLGGEALVPLVRAYDPERSPLVPFLHRRLDWAIRDALRRESHSRTHAFRREALAVADGAARVDSSEMELGGEGVAWATDEEPTPSVGRETGPGVVVPAGDMAEAREPRDDPEQVAARAREHERLRRAVAALPRRERELVEGHYFGGGRFDHVAADLGISKSWASRLHARALDRLARDLSAA